VLEQRGTLHVIRQPSPWSLTASYGERLKDGKVRDTRFTDSLRCELIHDSSAIRLSMVQLPAVNTPQFDWARSHMPRRMQPVAPIHAPDAIAETIAARIGRMPRELWSGVPTLKASDRW
jgi:hypothetical protein